MTCTRQAANYTPTVGVVVISHNRLLEDRYRNWCSVLANDLTGVDIAFVEGGTADEDILRENRHGALNWGVKHHWVRDAGKNTRSNARNYGALHVAGEYVYFVDGDTVPTSGCITALRKYASPHILLSSYVYFKQQNGDLWGDHREPFFTDHTDGVAITQYMWNVFENGLFVSRQALEGVRGFQAHWAANGYCWEGVDLWWRMFCWHFMSIGLVRESELVHLWHEPGAEKAATDENVPLWETRMWDTVRDCGLEFHPYILECLYAAQGAMKDRR